MEKFKEDCCQSIYYFYRSAAKCLVWVCEHYWEELDMKQRDGRASRNCQVLCALHLPSSVRYHIWARVNNTYCSTLVFYISHKFLWTNSILASYTEDSRKQSFYLTTLHRNVKDICKIINMSLFTNYVSVCRKSKRIYKYILRINKWIYWVF